MFRREYLLLKGKYVEPVGIENDSELTFLRFPYIQYFPKNPDGSAKYTRPLTKKLKQWWIDNNIPEEK